MSFEQTIKLQALVLKTKCINSIKAVLEPYLPKSQYEILSVHLPTMSDGHLQALFRKLVQLSTSPPEIQKAAIYHLFSSNPNSSMYISPA